MKLLCLSLLSATLLFGSIGHTEDETEIIGSTTAFRRLMKSPLLRDHFTYLQQDLIPTRFDSEIRSFFRSDQFLSTLYQAHIDNEEKTLQKFTDYAQTNMMRLRKIMGSEQGRQIHRMVVQLARSLGFSTEAVEHVMIYAADGSKNAFTVSASKNRIIIVFQSELLESLTQSEIRAIVGHELGHIVLGHSNLSKMNIFMVNLLHSVFVNPKSAAGAANMNQSMNKELKERFGHVCSSGCALNHSVSTPMNLANADEDVAIEQIEMQAFMTLSSKQNIQGRNILLIRYLNLALKAMDEYLAPAQSISIMQNFRDNLIATMENPEKYIGRSDLQDFSQAVTDMMNAISRSQEVSSDRVSDTVIKREYLASSFIRLLGLAKFEIQDRHKLITQVKDQAEEILSRMDRTALSKPQHIGTSHPSSVLRIYLITQIPSYPSIFIANPFTKLLALNQYESMEKGLAQYGFDQPAESKEDLQRKKYFEEHLKQTSEASEQITSSILTLLRSRRITDKHPRLNNLIQYSLVQREIQLNQMKELKEKIADQNTHPKAIQMLKHRLSMIENVFFPKNAEFLSKVAELFVAQKTQANTLSEARFQALQVAATSMDIEEVKKVRLALLALDPNRYWTEDVLADLSTPNFIVPRDIKSQEKPAEQTLPSDSLVRIFSCERILSGG